MTYNSSTWSTTVDVFSIDHSQPDRVNSTSFEINGSYSLLAHSRQCLIIKDIMGTVLVFREDPSTLSYVQDPFELSNVININGTFASSTSFGNGTNGTNATNGTNGTTATLWKVAENCERFRFGDAFYFRNSSGAFSPMNNPAGFESYNTDKSLDYAVGIDGKVYKYSTTQNAFELFFTPASSLPSHGSHSISVFNDRFIINTTSSNSVELYAYQIQANSLTLVLNFTDNKFYADPKVAVSPELTKIVVVGNGNITLANGSWGNGSMSHGFSIDWTAKTVENMTVPSEALQYGADYFLALGEEFLLMRQKHHTSSVGNVQTFSWQPWSFQYYYYSYNLNLR